MNLYKNRIVVKVGTSTLTNDSGKNNLLAFDKLTCVLSDIQNLGYEIILVSSGAIAIGSNKLNYPKNRILSRGLQNPRLFGIRHEY